jgi:hypothetical protein
MPPLPGRRKRFQRESCKGRASSRWWAHLVQATPCRASYPKNSRRQPSREAPIAACACPRAVLPAASGMLSGRTRKGVTWEANWCLQRRHCSSDASRPCSAGRKRHTLALRRCAQQICPKVQGLAKAPMHLQAARISNQGPVRLPFFCRSHAVHT